MLNLGCLFYRSRLERYADAALSARQADSIGAHLEGCEGCRNQLDGELRLKELVQSAVVQPPDPDWTAFWPGIQARMARQAPPPVRDPWWVPFWKPFWGHPRLALGSAMVAALALFLVLRPLDNGQMASVAAAPLVVQDVSTPDPNRAVMVYSTADSALTVIWLLESEAGTDES
jgi:hypothetical protein